MESNFVRTITTKIIALLIEEINKEDMQKQIKQKIITPVVQMIYDDLYPYIIALSITIVMILLFSILTFVSFVFYYFKK